MSYRHQTIIGAVEGRTTVGVDTDYSAVQFFASADYNFGYWFTRNIGVFLHLGVLTNVGGEIESNEQEAIDGEVVFSYDITASSLSNLMVQGGASFSWRF